MANPKCKKCGKVSILGSAFTQSFNTDEEPYKSGETQEQKEIETEIYINRFYCETCQGFVDIWISDSTNIIKEG
jgi:hypothetical protein